MGNRVKIGKLNYRLGLIGRFSIIVVTPSLYLVCVVEDSLLKVSREIRLYIFRYSYSLRHELSLILLTSTQERHKICFYRRCIVYSLLLEKYEVFYIKCSYMWFKLVCTKTLSCRAFGGNILKSILFRQICGNSFFHKFPQICRNSLLDVSIVNVRGEV